MANNFKTTFKLAFLFAWCVSNLFASPVVNGASAAAARPASPGPGWEFCEETGHWYKSYNKGETWPSANSTCVNQGAHLAIINSDDEKECLVRLMKHTFDVDCSGSRSLFAVGVYRDDSGIYKTVDGQTLPKTSYNEWSAGYPRLYRGWPNYRYGFMHLGNAGNLENWNDSFTNAFICEKETS